MNANQVFLKATLFDGKESINDNATAKIHLIGQSKP